MESLDMKIKEAEESSGKSDNMSNKEELKKLYEAAKNLDPGNIMRCINQAESDEERKFLAFIADMNLQRAQKQAIERNLF